MEAFKVGDKVTLSTLGYPHGKLCSNLQKWVGKKLTVQHVYLGVVTVSECDWFFPTSHIAHIPPIKENNVAAYNVDAKTHHKDQVLKVLLHYMDHNMRMKLMLECPAAYNDIVGQNVVTVVYTDDSKAVK